MFVATRKNKKTVNWNVVKEEAQQLQIAKFIVDAQGYKIPCKTIEEANKFLIIYKNSVLKIK